MSVPRRFSEIKRVSGGIAAAAATALAAATIGDDAATKKQKIEEAYKQNLTKFAEAIINRQKEAVEKMLRTDSTLLTTPVDLTDLDGGKIAKGSLRRSWPDSTSRSV